MGSSSGFGSTPPNSLALFRLAFAPAPPHGLTWLEGVTRRPIMQKVRSRPATGVAPRRTGLLPLVDIRVQVLFHSPHRGAFHLSLTVLVHYRSLARIEPWKVGLPASHRPSRTPWYSGTEPKEAADFGYRALTVSGRPFQSVPLASSLLTPRRRWSPVQFCPTTPRAQRLHACPGPRFGLLPFRSSLLRESRLLSLPPGTEIFHFPGSASTPYVFSGRCGGMTHRGFPHSGIPGSTPVSDSPGLIAADYALPRLRAPRHPPYALVRLTCLLLPPLLPSLQLSKTPPPPPGRLPNALAI